MLTKEKQLFGFNLTDANIVCDGNSLTSGGYGGLSYPTILYNDLSAEFSGIVVTGRGVGGQQTSQMIADGVSDVDSLLQQGKPNIVCVWEVGNDIYFNGSVSNAITNITTYCQARKTAGWKVALIGLCDRYQTTAFGDNPAQYRVKIESANNIMRSTYMDIGADVFVDLIADPRLDDALDSTYFNGDTVHLIQAGNQAVVDCLIPKLRLIR